MKTPGPPLPAVAAWDREAGQRGDSVEAAADTERPPLWIDETGRPHLHQDIAAAHRVEGAHDLAVPLRPARQQAEAEPMAERRRERDRGDIALIVVGDRLGSLGMRCAPARMRSRGRAASSPPASAAPHRSAPAAPP